MFNKTFNHDILIETRVSKEQRRKNLRKWLSNTDNHMTPPITDLVAKHYCSHIVVAIIQIF